MDAGKYLQKKRDLVALCQAQTEELAKTNQALTDAHGELEDALDDYDKVKTELRECRSLRDELSLKVLALISPDASTIERLQAELECAHQLRDKALLALRIVIGVIEMGTFEGQSVYRPDCAAREMEILTIAKAALKEARDEAVPQT